MKIVFVRHGHPDYTLDCLTELGHRQAEAVAERLRDTKFDKIFSSTCGRAYETAEHIVKGRDMEIVQLEFMREIWWGASNGDEISHRGHPWLVADDVVAAGGDLFDANWQENEFFCKNDILKQRCQKVLDGFDSWLSELGYEREGQYYRVKRANDETVALVSHGGSSSVVLSRLFNLPFPYVCTMVHPDFTGITEVVLNGHAGELCAPRFKVLNDALHIGKVEDPSYC